jgi:dephospho-CoA kinase
LPAVRFFLSSFHVKTFGLTGGIGMGKSASAQILRDRGAPVVDTDDLARRVVEPGEPALAEIRNAFGDEVIAADGQLRRDVLARRVFADSAARKELEDILHPRIRELWRAQLQAWQNERQAIAVVVIPLLFETRAETEFDSIICIACSASTQKQRLRARGWSQEQIVGRINAQIPVEEKMLRARYVVWTEGGLDLHAAQLERVLLLSR